MDDSFVVIPDVTRIRLMVLKEPEVLESNEEWFIVLCQHCDDKRTMELRWQRQKGRKFPDLLNNLRRYQMLLASGDYYQHAFVESGVLKCIRSIVATSVNSSSTLKDFDDGCKVPIKSVQAVNDQKDLYKLLKFVNLKIKMESMSEALEKVRLSSRRADGGVERRSLSDRGNANGPESGKQSSKNGRKSDTVSLAERRTRFEQSAGGWVHCKGPPPPSPCK